MKPFVRALPLHCPAATAAAAALFSLPAASHQRDTIFSPLFSCPYSATQIELHLTFLFHKFRVLAALDFSLSARGVNLRLCEVRRPAVYSLLLVI